MSRADARAATRECLAPAGGDATTLARLAQAAEIEPGLRRLVPFWQAIYRVQFATRDRLAAAFGPFAWSLRRERLLAGQPQLDLEDLPLAADALATWAQSMVEAWQPFDPACSLPEGEGWLARVRAAFLNPPEADGRPHEQDFAGTLAGLALVPYLEWAAAGVRPTLVGEMESWGRGCCPVCGGAPDLAVLSGDPAARTLVCSRCSTPWPYPRVGCPFCHDADHQAYYTDGDRRYRLYICPLCRRYLKAVTAPPAESVDPWAERLLTIGMDLAAREAGYG